MFTEAVSEAGREEEGGKAKRHPYHAGIRRRKREKEKTSDAAWRETSSSLSEGKAKPKQRCLPA